VAAVVDDGDHDRPVVGDSASASAAAAIFFTSARVRYGFGLHLLFLVIGC
jgi:hypothetical protein